MIKATMNQLTNLSNQHQTPAKKVLCVCSAGMLRSPTAANALHQKHGYNTRSCGSTDFALIPVTEALLLWADEVVLMHKDVLKNFDNEELKILNTKLTVLDIPDIYPFNHPELVREILLQYKV